MKKLALLFISFFALHNLYSQSIDMLKAEDELLFLLDDLRSAGNNQEKKEANSNFKTKLKIVLQDKAALDYPFSKLTTVGIINSSDKKMRIINWNVEQDDYSHIYNCFVLHADLDKRNTQLLNLSINRLECPCILQGVSLQTIGMELYTIKLFLLKKGAKCYTQCWVGTIIQL